MAIGTFASAMKPPEPAAMPPDVKQGMKPGHPEALQVTPSRSTKEDRRAFILGHTAFDAYFMDYCTTKSCEMEVDTWDGLSFF